jgi:hypothetical protein
VETVASALRPLPLLAAAVAVPWGFLFLCIDQAALAALPPSARSPVPTADSQPSLSPPPWQFAPADAGGSGWQPVQNEALLPPEFRPVPAIRNPADLSAEARAPKPPEHPDVLVDNIGIFGLGGGVQTGGGTGDRWTGVLTTRIGYKLNDNLALSLRPSFIFGNTDLEGNPNDQGAFQMPLTLDLFRRSLVSPYVGAGIATNTDSTGDIDPMITGGLDINLSRHLTLGLNVNYIIQSQISDTDWAAMTLVYFRF